MNSISGRVARNVERYRAVYGMSVSMLARSSGVSKATVLAIEAGESNPTLETLNALASAFRIEVTELLTDQVVGPVALHRIQDAVWRREEEGDLATRPLSSFYSPDLVYVLQARFGGEGYYSRGHEVGSLEGLYVLSGRIEAGPEGHTEALDPGDWIRFNADGPHRYRALGKRAEVLLVISRRQIPDFAGSDHSGRPADPDRLLRPSSGEASA